MPWRPTSHTDAAKAAAFARMARRLQRERDDAEEVIPIIVALVETQSAVRILSAWLTVGIAEKLGQAVAEVVDRSPLQARVLAEVALAIATDLGDDYHEITRVQTLAHAWGGLAFAYWREGNVSASLSAFERADETLAGHDALAHDLAVIDLARASLYRSIQRDEDARALLVSAYVVFLQHGDQRRAAECRRQLNQSHVSGAGHDYGPS